MLRPMSGRPTLFSLICQLFLGFTFLCAPFADSAHAIKMLQTKHDNVLTQSTMSAVQDKTQVTANTPCHEAIMLTVESSTSDKMQTNTSDDKKPCCPYKHCSPNHCLMQFAMASVLLYEITPHSPIDNRIFVDADIHLVTVPFTERLRPPIA